MLTEKPIFMSFLKIKICRSVSKCTQIPDFMFLVVGHFLSRLSRHNTVLGKHAIVIIVLNTEKTVSVAVHPHFPQSSPLLSWCLSPRSLCAFLIPATIISVSCGHLEQWVSIYFWHAVYACNTVLYITVISKSDLTYIDIVISINIEYFLHTPIIHLFSYNY